MLKLEYLPNASIDCPLIRLYDHDVEDVAALRDVCTALAEGSIAGIELDSQPWVQPIDGCRLTLKCTPENVGVTLSAQGDPFELRLSRAGWSNVCDMLEPFVDGAAGYSWLSEEGDVSVLISWSGQW